MFCPFLCLGLSCRVLSVVVWDFYLFCLVLSLGGLFLLVVLACVVCFCIACACVCCVLLGDVLPFRAACVVLEPVV